MLKYNPQHENVRLDSSDFPELTNISNKVHSSLLKPFTPNDDIHFPERILNRPGPVVEDRWQVEKVLEFRSQPSLVSHSTKSNGKDRLLRTSNGSSHQIWRKTTSSKFGYMVVSRPPSKEERPRNPHITDRAEREPLT